MKSLIFSRTSLMWLLLVAATMVALRTGFDSATDPRLARMIVLAVAFIKVHFVMREFMELRFAPLPMRIAADVWCLSVFSALSLLFSGIL